MNIRSKREIEKVVINLSFGRMTNAQSKEAELFLSQITGQKPALLKSRKNISNFSIRSGMESGFMVTLRKDRAENFLKKLIWVALPSDPLFTGFKKTVVNNNTINLGVRNPVHFPEVNKLEHVKGFNVTIVASQGYDCRKIAERLLIPMF